MRRCCFSMEVVILDLYIGRTPALFWQLPSLVWYHPSSVFSSFLRCLENLISSLGCHPPHPQCACACTHTQSCPASLKTTLMYSSYFPISRGVTLYSGVLEFQDSLLIIVFALSSVICQRKATFSWGKRGCFFQPTPLNGLPSYCYSLSPRQRPLSRCREGETRIICLKAYSSPAPTCP